MTAIGLASVKGSPGVTTFALALATAWPVGLPVLLAELDASGGDIAGCFRLPPDPGVASLATEIRRDRDPELLFRNAQTLPTGVKVIPAPVGPGQAQAALTALAVTLPEVVQRLPRNVSLLADLGRLNRPSIELANSMDRLLILAKPRLADLVHLEGLAEAVPHAELVLVGQGPYPPGEVTDAVGLKILAHLRHDPAAQAFLEGRRRRTRLLRAARQIGAVLASPFELEPSA
ncbi:hypothetical protein [Microtetraspora malaysiensis]|uniref:Chromosome partitioning protein n=1 Tax=Microtetraspora malaysiensis TaxID=161358 RepID=A0ABW6T1W9_9ACTN